MENLKIYQALKDCVSIINKALNGTEYPKIDNYSLAYAVSKNHGVQSLFSLGIKGDKFIGEELKTLVDKTYNVETLQLSTQEYYAEKIFSLLKEKGIKFMPLKGYLLRNLYPKKEMRNSCDIDFYFDVNSKKEVDKIIKDLGFTFSHKGQSHDVWKLNTITIEPHFKLFGKEDNRFSDFIETSFEKLKVVDGVEYSFTNEDYYLYMVYHAYKHMLDSALSIRTIVDFYVFNKFVNYDNNYVQDCLEKLNLKTFEYQIKKLLKVWFDNEVEDSESYALNTFIAKNSLFGEMSNLVVFKNDLTSKDKGLKKKIFLKRVFPSSKELKDKYGWYKTPILYPIAWLVRLFTLIIKRPKDIKNHYNTIKNVDANRVAEIENVRKILKIW